MQADIRSAQRIGVTGVPTFIVANRYGLVGAQPPEELARAFVAATDEIAASRTGTAGLALASQSRSTAGSSADGRWCS